MKDDNYKNLNAYYLQKLPFFKSITQNLTNNSPLDYFSYQRLYLGGKHLILFTNESYSQHFFNTINDLGPSFSERIKKTKLNELHYHIWPFEPNTTYFQDMFDHNIWNGLTIHVRRADFVEAYYFATSKKTIEPTQMVNFYLNKLEFLKNYIDFFNKNASAIIDVKDAKILGQHTGSYVLENFEEKILISSSQTKKEYFTINDNLIYLTPQELKCLDHMSKGYSNKFIAKILNLSPRTVEAYLQSVKLKTGFGSRDLLLDWFYKNKPPENINLND